MQQVTKNLIRLTEEETESCEDPFTNRNCWKVVTRMATGKSPRSDGFPAEFYMEFFPEISPILIKIANAHAECQPLTRSQRAGIRPIIILPKNRRVIQVSIQQLAARFSA